MRPLSTLCAALLAAGLSVSAAAADYLVTTIDYPGAANTAIYALNDLGHYVGAEKSQDGTHHAIFNTTGQLMLLDPTGPIGTATESWAYSTNNRGDIAGALVDAGGTSHGYVHHADGAVEMIDYPGGFDTQAYGINDHGTVIGMYNDAAGNGHAFVRRNGVYAPADLPGAYITWPLSIDDREQIAGQYQDSADTVGYGYVQQEGGRFRLASAPEAPAKSTWFISIDNRHDVLGSYLDADLVQHNFIARGKTYTPFELPPTIDAADGVSAQTINDRGDIVGLYFDSNAVAHGYYAKALDR
ncbi:MAG: hypothetical protein JSR59_10880 [Proteobacteria bacterium]|nr:hypothetical protein [Pseudomonadota bacterium]